jgi:acyl-CoA dehydrogenase
MDFACSPKVEELRARLERFLVDQVVPRDADWHRQVEAGRFPPDFAEALKARARSEGLWNLFLPGLGEGEPGTRCSNLEYAPLAELMGRIPWSSELFNCSAPDTGNMELLHLFASEAQRERWLVPLLAGEIRSAFCMSEPEVASSDATNLRTAIRREGDTYAIDGRKWFITGALHPRCRLLVVMGVTNPEAEPHRRQSLVLVPRDATGVRVLRNIPVLQHRAPEGHCEIAFENVRVPLDHRLGAEGDGFALAQARLGPGRVHHCMRSIGQCEVALELMIERALERRAFGKPLADHDSVRERIALSRNEIDQARLLVLHAAWLMDQGGNQAARGAVAQIKVVVARLHTTVLDRAIQLFGAMGLSPDTPLAELFTWGRALRFADGPDEVHLRSIARDAIRRHRAHGPGRVLPHWSRISATLEP